MSRSQSSLKALVIRGASWTIASYGAAQLMRLGRSLVLTRLLFPDAFGIMSIVWAVMYGLEMLSDVGIGSAIIRDKRGDEPDFLNTAWTLQAVRGAALWAMSCLVAGPAADFYGQPELAYLIPVAGLTALIAGFNSTGLHTCRRRMEFRRLSILELANEGIGFVAVTVWAYLYPTVWSLVGGALISRVSWALMSHLMLPGVRNRFRLEQSSLRVLVSFGKWIFLSSMFWFVSVQGDRILLGRFLDMAQLGVYSIATLLSEAIHSLVVKLTSGVLFAAYGGVVRDEPATLNSVLNKARLGIDAALVAPIAVLMVIGGEVVHVLYDARYADAGWMLQLFCIRLAMAATLSNSEVVLVALGQPEYAFLKNALRAVWIVAGIPIAWATWGVSGVVWVVASSELPVAAALWFGLIRHGVFSLGVELRSLLFVGAGALAGTGLLHLVR